MTNKEDQESDNESVATEDIVEPTPEPVTKPVPSDPFAEPTVHLNTIVPDPEPTPVPMPKPKKAQGRPRKARTSPDKTDATLGALTKGDLIKLVTSQHDLLNRRALIDKEQEEFIKQKTTNKVGKTPAKEKKARTPAQIAATARMVAARKAKQAKDVDNSKREIVKEIDNSIADKVEEAVTNIIMKPMRALTPERMKKVEKYIEPPKKSRF